MRESLARVDPSQAQMHLDIIGWVNIADGQDFIAHMVDYSAGYGIGNRLLRDLSQANEVRTALLFVCTQNYLLRPFIQTVWHSRMKELPAGGLVPGFLSFLILAVDDKEKQAACLAHSQVRFKQLLSIGIPGLGLLEGTVLVRSRERIATAPPPPPPRDGIPEARCGVALASPPPPQVLAFLGEAAPPLDPPSSEEESSAPSLAVESTGGSATAPSGGGVTDHST